MRLVQTLWDLFDALRLGMGQGQQAHHGRWVHAQFPADCERQSPGEGDTGQGSPFICLQHFELGLWHLDRRGKIDHVDALRLASLTQ